MTREVDRETTVAVFPLRGAPNGRKDLSMVAAALLAHAVDITVADWQHWQRSVEVDAERRDEWRRWGWGS